MSSIGSDDGMKSSDNDDASASETEGESSAAAPVPVGTAPAATVSDAAAPLTDEQLDEPVTIQLSETPTIWLLEITGTAVASDAPDAEEVKKKNEAYEKLLKAHEEMADMYVPVESSSGVA